MNASVTISRRSTDEVIITIDDDSNFNLIVEVALSLEEYAKLITGQSSIKGTIKNVLSDEAYSNLGKEKEVKRVSCEKYSGYTKEKQREMVISDFEEKYRDEGWVIKHDGTTSRQDGKQHQYIIYRYKE